MAAILPTKFALAEVATPEEVLRQSQYFMDAPPLHPRRSPSTCPRGATTSFQRAGQGRVP